MRAGLRERHTLLLLPFINKKELILISIDFEKIKKIITCCWHLFGCGCCWWLFVAVLVPVNNKNKSVFFI
jgi:hypothetical protein